MKFAEYLLKWFIAATAAPIRLVEIAAAFLAVGGGATRRFFPNWKPETMSIIWKVALGVLLGVSLISLAVSSFNMYKQKNKDLSELAQQLEAAKKQAYPSIATLMLEPYFKERDIPLGEFGLVNQGLSNKTFEKCRIHGPAVVFLIANNTIAGCNVGGGESSFIVTTNVRIGGVLGLENCSFYNCNFFKVSFIGNAETIAKIRSGFTLKPAQ